MMAANDNGPAGELNACGYVFTHKQFDDGLGVACRHLLIEDITTALRIDEDLATYHICCLSGADMMDPAVLATGVAGLKGLVAGGAR